MSIETEAARERYEKSMRQSAFAITHAPKLTGILIGQAVAHGEAAGITDMNVISADLDRFRAEQAEAETAAE